MIEKIEYKDDQYIYPVIFNYFHSYLVRFGSKHGIDYLTQDTYVLESHHLQGFRTLVKEALEVLLKECYKEPSHKHRSKYAGRFEKIYFDSVMYVVDYRTDYIGKILYGLYYLLNWLNKHIGDSNSEEE